MQRPLLYLGEINDRQKAAWTKVTEVFDALGQQTQELALHPADRAVPEHAAHYGVQVRLAEFALRRPRQWVAGCGISCTWMSFGVNACPTRGRGPVGGKCWRR